MSVANDGPVWGDPTTVRMTSAPAPTFPSLRSTHPTTGRVIHRYC
jgi:hypothetical protein